MIVRHFSNSPPGASAHAHWYCDKGGLGPRIMMYQSLFDRAVHECTRRKSTLKDPPDCLPGVLCIPSLIVHGMTMGRCNAHLVIAIFHVFRTRLQGDHGCPGVHQGRLRKKASFSRRLCIDVSIYL
uniref:Uncharacterized protein n=1 Tax=Rhipicephalus microplus TaxID=6941 RepID=A0A6G5AFI5_RHIMP